MKYRITFLSALLCSNLLIMGCATTGTAPSSEKETAPAAPTASSPTPTAKEKTGAEPECD